MSSMDIVWAMFSVVPTLPSIKRTGEARGNSVWRTDGVYLSVYCDHRAKIYWDVVLN